MKVASKRILFHCNFDYKHFIYKINQKNIKETIQGNCLLVSIG